MIWCSFSIAWGVNRTVSRWLASYQELIVLDDPPHMTTPPVNKQRAVELREILAAQRDQHARQRELVRASLAWCPGKSPRPAQPR